MLKSLRTTLLELFDKTPENAPDNRRLLAVDLEDQSSNIQLLLFEQVVANLLSIRQLLQQGLNKC